MTLVVLRAGSRDGQVLDLPLDDDRGHFFEAEPSERYLAGDPVVTRDTDRGEAVVLTYAGPTGSSSPSGAEGSRA